MITRTAPAKVNLTLEVLGRRPDGYHEVRTIMQSIDVCDTLTFEEGSEVSLECSDPALRNADNLVIKAALLLKQRTRCCRGVRINLVKQIPTAAGLGGGSSDAAATLIGLNDLWDLGLSKAELSQHAAHLGSDVPFFLYTPGTALAEGRGDTITPIGSTPREWVVLLFPPFELPREKTANLYAALTSESFNRGERTSRAMRRIDRGLPLMDEHLCNAFDAPANQMFTGLGEFRKTAEKEIGRPLHLSGSGPTLFAWSGDVSQATRIYQELKKLGHAVHLAQTTASSDKCPCRHGRLQ